MNLMNWGKMEDKFNYNLPQFVNGVVKFDCIWEKGKREQRLKRILLNKDEVKHPELRQFLRSLKK